METKKTTKKKGVGGSYLLAVNLFFFGGGGAGLCYHKHSCFSFSFFFFYIWPNKTELVSNFLLIYLLDTQSPQVKVYTLRKDENGLMYLSDCLENFFLMRVHFCECADLCQVHIFSVSQGHNFIKGENEGESLVCNL